jgi:hypothetical protein
MKVVLGTKCFQKFFKIFFAPKIRSLDRYKYQKKVILFGFSTGTKGEFRFFSPLVTKSEKYHFFTLGPGTKSPRNRRKKFKKKFFLVISIGPKTLFLGLKKF